MLSIALDICTCLLRKFTGTSLKIALIQGEPIVNRIVSLARSLAKKPIASTHGSHYRKDTRAYGTTISWFNAGTNLFSIHLNDRLRCRETSSVLSMLQQPSHVFSDP